MLALAVAMGCGDVPAVGLELPLVDAIYACTVDRDGGRFVVKLCYDGSPEELADAIVAHEERVTNAVCDPSPVGQCLYSCEPDQDSCAAENGCYCK